MAQQNTAQLIAGLQDEIGQALPHATTAVHSQPHRVAFAAVVPVSGGMLRVAMDNRAPMVPVEFYPRAPHAGDLLNADRPCDKWQPTPAEAIALGKQARIAKVLANGGCGVLPYYDYTDNRVAAVRMILMNAEQVVYGGLDGALRDGAESLIRLRRQVDAHQAHQDRISDIIETRRVNAKRTGAVLPA